MPLVRDPCACGHEHVQFNDNTGFGHHLDTSVESSPTWITYEGPCQVCGDCPSYRPGAIA